MIDSRVASNRTCYRATTTVPPGRPTVFVDDPDDDDTIEMELGPADVRRLAQAAEEQQRAASEAESMAHAPLSDAAPPVGAAPAAPQNVMSKPQETQTSVGSAQAQLERETPRRGASKSVKSAAFGALAGATGALVIVAAIASWSTAHHSTPVETPPPPVAATEVPSTVAPVTQGTPAATAPQEPAVSETTAPESQPLRYKNPFDKSEIFEFPAGTTPAEARKSVANLLMQRARDRKVQPPGLQRSRINGTRSAKNTDLAQNNVRSR